MYTKLFSTLSNSLCICLLLTSCEQQVKTNSVFWGMCDASAAVPLSERLFAVADDEDNLLRVYDAYNAGLPLASHDLSAQLGLKAKPRKNLDKPPKPLPELDIEGAAIYGGLAYWITSHGRNSSGEFKEERLRFFATRLGDQRQSMDVVGPPYERLLDDLLNEPLLSKFNLADASRLAPKSRGGLNIEGLSARKQGGLWIGFRNPIPDNHALLIPLLNPELVIDGNAPHFGDPVLLDLGGRGIRGMTLWRGHYLIAAGDYDQGLDFQIYRWDGTNEPILIKLKSGAVNTPEAFFASEKNDHIMLLNDQGSVSIAGKECKKLKNTEEKFFTANWIKLL
jgi:Protein of unknown function (DUF3616)